MKKLVLFMHVSLDGFVAGPNGEMNWINVSEQLFDFAGDRTKHADTALYGRVTYQMMDGYWPTAADEPNASKHDIEHSAWYNRVTKVVVSRTMQGADSDKTKIIGEQLGEEIRELKQGDGQDILIFGSPSVVHALTADNLIDEYWLFVNPVLLGAGIPLFQGNYDRTQLTLVSVQSLDSGVVGLHYHATRV